MKYLAIYILVASVKLVEYKLWKYYGQIIPDTSSNNNHAVNGVSSSKDSNDCLYSDRGLYFSHETSALKLPPNDKIQNEYKIPAPYTVIMWLNNFQNQGWYFSRRMNLQYLIIKSSNKNIIEIEVKILDSKVDLSSSMHDRSGK